MLNIFLKSDLNLVKNISILCYSVQLRELSRNYHVLNFYYYFNHKKSQSLVYINNTIYLLRQSKKRGQTSQISPKRILQFSCIWKQKLDGSKPLLTQISFLISFPSSISDFENYFLTPQIHMV